MASEKVAETSSGMPQLDFATFPNQFFWILVFTVLFYLIVRYVIVPRLENIMTSRQDLINADIQQAEEFNKEAHKIEEQITLKMDEAHREALNISASTKAQLKEKVDSAMIEIEETVSKQTQDSEKRISDIEKKSKQNIKEISIELSKDLIGRFSENKLETSKVEKMVSDQIKGRQL